MSSMSFPKSKGGVIGPERAPSIMAKTWIPKTGTKSAKAFAKAMRALQSPRGGRGFNNRPR
jgi:hypothetical protein